VPQLYAFNDDDAPLENDGYATGPDPGERIPEFALPDQSGAIRTPSDLAGSNGLFLVFHRSADW
jgi:hypothetical protein